MDREQPNFFTPDHIEDAVFVETLEPDAADIFKPNGIEQRIGGKRSDDGIRFIKKIITESRLLAVIPGSSLELVFFNESRLFDGEAHGVGRGHVR